MKSTNPLTLTTSPQSQPSRKPRRTASLTRRQRLLYGRKRHYSSVKERDTETGLYYYGARYLDGKTSRWLSGDPAMGEYIPSAPVDDEARKRNGRLPGHGGVFNYVNLHVYHYAGNNPVKYVDPDGRQSEPPGPPPSNIPGSGTEGWRFSPNPRNPRGGVWRPNPPRNGPQPSASWESPDPNGKGVGHWDVDDGEGNRQRYLPDGTPISAPQAHGDEPLPDSPNSNNTQPTPGSSNDTEISPDYKISDPGGLLKPDITNPDFVPKKPSAKPPIIIPFPVPGFRLIPK